MQSSTYRANTAYNILTTSKKQTSHKRHWLIDWFSPQFITNLLSYISDLQHIRDQPHS